MSDIIDMTKGRWRRLYGAAVNGRRINLVSIEAEFIFWRAVMIADDLGNFPADPVVFKGMALPRRKFSPKRIITKLYELAHIKDESGTEIDPLITQYVGEDGETYCHIEGWEVLQPMGYDRFRNKIKPVRRYPIHPEKRSLTKPYEAHTKKNEVYDHENENEHENEHKNKINNETKKGHSPQEISPDDSCSCSPDQNHDKTAGADPVQDLRTIRLKHRADWLMKTSALWSRDGGKQKSADHTSTQNLFDEIIWPEEIADGQQRITAALVLVTKARGKDRPMAWLTVELKRTLVAESAVPA